MHLLLLGFSKFPPNTADTVLEIPPRILHIPAGMGTRSIHRDEAILALDAGGVGVTLLAVEGAL